MMESQSPLTSPVGSSNRNTPETCPHPLDSWDSTQKNQENPQKDQGENLIMDVEVKEEDEKMSVRRDQPLNEEENPSEICRETRAIRCVKAEEDGHGRVKEEMTIKDEQDSLQINTSTDVLSNRTIEESYSHPLCSQGTVQERQDISPDQGENLSTCKAEVKEEPEDVDVMGAEPFFKKEEIPPEISTDKRLAEKDLCASEDAEPEDEIVTSDSSDECPTTPDPSPRQASSHSRRGRRTAKPSRTQASRPASQRKSGEFQCYECGKSFLKIEQLLSHQRTHTAKQHSCAECGKYYARKSSLIRHQQIHTGEEPFPCLKCDKSFILKTNLISHMRTHAGSRETRGPSKDVQIEAEDEEHMQISEDPPEISTDTVKCSITPPMEDIRGDSPKHTPITISAPNNVEQSLGPSMNEGSIPNQSRTVTFNVPSNCGGGLSCYECGAAFSSIKELLSHQRTHSTKKSFNCSECGKCFRFRTLLIAHERSHTGEKPFSCPECGKGFSQKSTVTAHMRTHTGEKPHICSECGMGFSQTRLLRLHLRNHTGEKPFSCAECGKSFKQKTVLITHQRIHTGEMPYSCTECGKRFAQRPALIAHERVHTGEKPYSCSECGKSFTRKYHLDVHRKNVHSH